MGNWEEERSLLLQVQTLNGQCNRFKTNLQLIEEQNEMLTAEVIKVCYVY